MPPARTESSSSRESPAPSTSAVPLAERACEACRERKLKCSRKLPECDFCTPRGLECKYERKVRTPLTRKNLDFAEARILQLEAALAASTSEMSASGGPDAGARQRKASNASPVHSAGSATVQTTSLLPESIYTPRGSAAPDVIFSSQPPLHFRLPDESTFSVQLPQPATPATWSGNPDPSSDQDAQMADDAASASEFEADGTGSLDIEEGGKAGFLGPVSGAALLKFLQRVCATDGRVFVAPPKPRSAPSPSSALSSAISGHMSAAYVDAYFALFHKNYPIVHEGTFRAQLADVIPRPHGPSWSLLQEVIKGLGSTCMPERQDQGDSLAILARANKLVNVHVLETSNLTGTQAFILLANLAQKLNRPNLGHVYLGVALRMAMALGLHREPAASLSVFEQESRRRVYWTLHCFELGSILTFGHDCTLPNIANDQARVRPITNVPDDKLTPNVTSMPPPVDRPTIYSSLQQHSDFHTLANDIVQQTLSNLTPSDMLRIESEVIAWRNRLPAYFFAPNVPPWFEFARERIQWRCEHLRMVVLRPAFLYAAHEGSQTGQTFSPELETCWNHCVASAMATMHSMKAFVETVPQRTTAECFYVHLFTFPAAFVLLIALRTRPQHADSFEWLLSVQAAVSILEHVKHNPLAERCSQIIRAVVAIAQKQPSADQQQDTDQSSLPPPTDMAPQYLPTPDLTAFPSNLLTFFGDNNLDPNLAAVPSATTTFDALLAQWLTRDPALT